MTRRPAPRRPLAWALALGAAAVLALGAFGSWYLFLRPSGPMPVAIGAVGAAPGASGPIDGTWQVDPSLGSFSDFTSSFVGYRVQEELANIGAKTAVGRTPNVSGTMTISGTTVTAASYTADLTTLQSDDQRRDGQLRRQALETGTYPTATFKLTQPIELGALPADGATIDATATGELTLHGQTRTVNIPLQAKRSGNEIDVTGTLQIVFADYGIQKPSSFIVLSVADNGILEVQLRFTKA